MNENKTIEDAKQAILTEICRLSEAEIVIQFAQAYRLLTEAELMRRSYPGDLIDEDRLSVSDL